MSKDFDNEYYLLESLKNRSAKAFDYLYMSSRNQLYVLALSIVKNEEAAKDILQEFFTDFWLLELYNNIDKSLNAYLFFSVKNKAIDYYRRERSYRQFISQMNANPFGETPRYFENQELKALIEAKIESLPPMPAKTFRMHYMDNLSHQDIADKLGLTKQTVSNHIYKALKELRKSIKKSL